MRSTINPYGFSWGPEFTPTSVKTLIFITSFLMLFCALIDPLFFKFFGIPGPVHLLGLSLYSFSHYSFWQPTTYFFVEQSYGSINLFFLINLAFQMYVIWIMGSAIATQYGSKSFLKLYFSSGICSALLLLFFLKLIGTDALITGCLPPLFALFTVWTMMNPENELILFFVFPFKAKWLFALILTASFLILISQGDVITFSQIFFGSICGYIYGTAVYQLMSPYPFTNRLDNLLVNLGIKFRNFPSRKGATMKKSNKIIDIRDAETSFEEEEQFIDRMLAKISATGEKSLTANEKDRLNKISEKKAKNQSKTEK